MKRSSEEYFSSSSDSDDGVDASEFPWPSKARRPKTPSIGPHDDETTIDEVTNLPQGPLVDYDIDEAFTEMANDVNRRCSSAPESLKRDARRPLSAILDIHFSIILADNVLVSVGPRKLTKEIHIVPHGHTKPVIPMGSLFEIYKDKRVKAYATAVKNHSRHDRWKFTRTQSQAVVRLMLEKIHEISIFLGSQDLSSQLTYRAVMAQMRPVLKAVQDLKVEFPDAHV